MSQATPTSSEKKEYMHSFVPDSPFMCTVHTQMCAHAKDSISICHKRVGLTAGGMETQKHCTQGKKKKLGSTILWLFAFPRESSPNVLFIALGQGRYQIKSNLLSPPHLINFQVGCPDQVLLVLGP